MADFQSVTLGLPDVRGDFELVADFPNERLLDEPWGGYISHKRCLRR